MRVVGITGRSGCGKSTVTSWLAAQGYPCVDADAVAREVLAPGSPEAESLLSLLQKQFGCDIVDSGGALRRRLLADRAFATPQGTQALSAITHPAILARVRRAIAEARAAGERLLFLDGAAIVGTPFQELCDVLIVITAPEAECIRRICARDGIDETSARRRLAAQAPESVLCAAADHCLKNNSTPQVLLQQAADLLAKL